MSLCTGISYPGYSFLWIYDDTPRILHLAQTHCMAGAGLHYLRRLWQTPQQTRKKTRPGEKAKRIDNEIG